MKIKMVTLSGKLCTVGKMHLGMTTFCTMEKPWNDNQEDISCIPAGVYKMKYRVSPKQGPTFYLENEKLGVTLDKPNTRTYIQIDVANIQSELLGCIAVGMGNGVYKGEWSVTSSKPAKDILMELLGTDEHELTIERY